MDIQHITLTAERESRLPLFPDEGRYLEALVHLGAVCQGCLALFALVAEHLHLVACLSRAAAGRLAQAVLVSLGSIAATPLAASHIRPVETRAHLRWLHRYVLEQPKTHGMPGPAALWVGSCYPELVGARAIDGLSLRIEQVMPDVSIGATNRIVGVPGSRVPPADGDALRRAGLHRLAVAAAAAAGLSGLDGKSARALAARRAMAQLAEGAGFRLGEVALTLGQSERTAFRLRLPLADPALTEAVARRITLEDLVRQTALPSPENAIRRAG